MRLVGVNFDPRQLAVARKQVSVRPENRIEFLEADACALPFPRASFDRALAVECIFHFPSRLAFLKQVARVLEPDGLVALSDFVPWRHRGGGWLGRHVKRRIGRGYGSLGDDWRNGDYAAMARIAGLVIEQDRDLTAHTLPTYSFLMQLMRRDPVTAATLAGPTRLLWWISALRLVRYRLLVLRKPPSAPRS
jgi:SAM-dependent methyltransferase